MPKKVVEHLQLNCSPENFTCSKGAPVPQSFACLSQRAVEWAVPPWPPSLVLLLAAEAVQAAAESGEGYGCGLSCWCLSKQKMKEKLLHVFAGTAERRKRLELGRER